MRSSPSRARTVVNDQPLIWLGDLNVAAAWNDVGPDPDWFRNQNGQTALHADDKGQPGFTANEQSRFAALLDTGGLIDAYRLLHPTADWQRDVVTRRHARRPQSSRGAVLQQGDEDRLRPRLALSRPAHQARHRAWQRA